MSATLNDFIIEYPNALSDELCDRLVRKYEENTHLTYSGHTGSNEKMEEEVKVSTDLYITSADEFRQEDTELTEVLSQYLKKYHQFMANFSITYAETAGVFDKGYQMQKTTPGGHYWWHTDEYVGCYADSMSTMNVKSGHEVQVAAMERRMYTYIFYLNDQEEDFEGGLTEFIVGIDDVRRVKPEKGKLVMFPANPLCTHQGAEVTKGEKYIATGWVCDIVFSNAANDTMFSPTVQERFEEYKNQFVSQEELG